MVQLNSENNSYLNYLSFDEIIYITRFLNLKNTFNFIKSLNWNLRYIDTSFSKSILLKNKKLMVIETIYKSYFNNELNNLDILQELLEFFHFEIDLEDLICFMANIYPNFPRLKNTILFDLLKFYNLSKVDWTLIKTHFKLKKSELKELI
jgi:hypothetical protein